MTIYGYFNNDDTLHVKLNKQGLETIEFFPKSFFKTKGIIVL
jgi:hypothetical protein